MNAWVNINVRRKKTSLFNYLFKTKHILLTHLCLTLSLQPTRPDRGWVVMPIGKNPWWMYLASFVPALLVTILIFMDQQITAVIVNRKENKLKV